MPCKKTNRYGQPCQASEHLLDENNLCPSHRPGGLEHMRAVASLGGQALRAKRERARPLSIGELRKVNTLAQARHRLDFVQRLALVGRLTPNQATAATKAISEWIRAYQVGLTEELVTKLQTAVQQKEKEIEALKRQLQGRPERRRLGDLVDS